jgi:hypothetical protein
MKSNLRLHREHEDGERRPAPCMRVGQAALSVSKRVLAGFQRCGRASRSAFNNRLWVVILKNLHFQNRIIDFYKFSTILFQSEELFF